MIATKKYSLLAYSLLKGQVRYLLPYFESLKVTIQKADLGVALDEYIASYILSNLIALPAAFVIIWVWIATFLNGGILEILISELVGLSLVSGMVVLIYMIYPQYRVNTLKNALDKHVAFAATHMATIAGTGVPPHVIFQMMGQFDDYGEIAKECRSISQNIVVFGYDTLSAISDVAQRTPSHKFKDLLWSIVATIRTGGDLRQMLVSKSKALMEEQRRIEGKYIETLSMFAEIYSTVFVAGIVMVFVLLSIMGILGGLPVPVKLVLQLTTYLGLPLAAIGFIVLIETSKPSGI
ncbi:type II secretion system F family protein [archaeon]